jgi:RHH-type transcriptional regulator, rel operon repressor / antitoxin RelB
MLDLKIELPKKLEEHLNYLEIISKRPRSFFVQEALIRFLEEAEDIRDALERSQKEGKTYTTEELLKELGINV